ncbi:hopanoid biosynthesis-associated protein HpnK [Sphingomonas sp.]|uniref:hopanoid biosynthesis-associated protein HpnK n=1 Tax=Sphingomonas sp. TaxID=28214 RepID=UPI000DB096CC|nr:hopanoid biosynthesis-associated protein HpnK [Sphingomonas sp.]PZU06231.1 MAG: PTS cellobiose transporter [Sphingomonas sp.]
MRRSLIVTADDFGASHAVNEAVERAHRHGILTAASLMVAGQAADDAIARAKAMPGLGVGLHVVLVEGRPVLPPAQVPDLVDASGRFREDMVGTAFRIALKPGVRRQLHAEIEAQFAAFAATGLPLDHVNTHKHFHLHPMIASAILSAGRRHGLRAMRAPVEPRAILASIEMDRPPRRDPAAFWARSTARRLARAGLRVPDQVFGLAWTGAMTAARVRGIVERLPEGISELYLHPATDGGWEGAAPGYDYAGELAALVDPDVIASAHERARLMRFADLA